MTNRNKAYFYDPITREFVGIVLLDRDPLGGGFLLPANAVTAKPVLVEDKAPVLSDDGQTWLQVDDYRGLDVYQITDGTAHRVNALGALPDGVTTIKPAPAAGERIAEFDVKNQSWLYRPDYTGCTVYSIADGSARVLTEADAQIPGGYTTEPRPSEAHDWDTKAGTWNINKTKQAELDAQAALAAGQARLHEIEQAIQSHINQTVAALGMGFADDQSLIGKYAGYDNVFRPIAEAVGKWVAEIWYLAAQDKAAIIEGKKSIPTVSEAIARIPPLVMPEQQKVGE